LQRLKEFVFQGKCRPCDLVLDHGFVRRSCERGRVRDLDGDIVRLLDDVLKEAGTHKLNRAQLFSLLVDRIHNLGAKNDAVSSALESIAADIIIWCKSHNALINDFCASVLAPGVMAEWYILCMRDSGLIEL